MATTSGDLWSVSFLGIPWLAWGALCLVVASIYLTALRYPLSDSEARELPSWRRVALRWLHSIVWAVLAISCFMRPFASSRLADAVALLALPLYTAFLVALVQAIGRKQRKRSSQDKS